MSAVHPIYQDRRGCPTCGTLLERLMDCGEDGGNRPAFIPEDAVRKLGWTYTANDLFAGQYVRIDYFCARCNAGVIGSQSRPYTRELPDSAYYDPDDRPAEMFIDMSQAG